LGYRYTEREEEDELLRRGRWWSEGVMRGREKLRPVNGGILGGSLVVSGETTGTEVTGGVWKGWQWWMLAVLIEGGSDQCSSVDGEKERPAVDLF